MEQVAEACILQGMATNEHTHPEESTGLIFCE
jgi:hypothetical protein